MSQYMPIDAGIDAYKTASIVAFQTLRDFGQDLLTHLPALYDDFVEEDMEACDYIISQMFGTFAALVHHRDTVKSLGVIKREF